MKQLPKRGALGRVLVDALTNALLRLHRLQLDRFTALGRRGLSPFLGRKRDVSVRLCLTHDSRLLQVSSCRLRPLGLGRQLDGLLELTLCVAERAKVAALMSP